MLHRSAYAPAVAWLSCFALSNAAAEPFDWQLSGGVTRTDQANGVTDEGAALSATYHFEPIDDSNGPLALASFLDPTSQMFVAADRAEIQPASSTIGSSSRGVREVESYALGGRYMLAASRWYAGGTFRSSYTEPTPTAFGSRGSDADSYTLVAGKYLGARTTLSLALGRSQDTTLIPPSCSFVSPFCPTYTTILEVEARSATLDVFRLWQGRSVAYTLSGAVSQSAASIDVTLSPPPRPMTSIGPPAFVGGGIAVFAPRPLGDRVNVYRVAGEIFPTERLGVRLGYSRADADGVEPSDGTSELSATWYFRPRIGVQFSYSRDEYDSGFHAQANAIRLIGRF
jgi:hypothetical protein